MSSTARSIEAEETGSRQRFRLLFDDAPDACYLSDLSGKFVDGNRAAELLTGYRREELIGKSFLKIGLLRTHELPKALALLARNRLGRSTGPDEFNLVRRDGQTVRLEITTRPFEYDDRSLIFGIARDISRRKEIAGDGESVGALGSSTDRDSLGDEPSPDGLEWGSAELFQGFMNHCPLPAIVRDGSGRFVFLNESAKRVFELSQTDWKNRTVFDLLPGENAERLRRQDQSVLTRLEPVESIIVLRGGEGERQWLSRSFPLKGTGGETLVGGWAFDVTEHQAAVDALRDSDKRYRALLDQSRELIQSVAPDGRFLFVNRAWRDTLGYSEDESRNMVVGDVVKPERQSEFDENLSRVITGTSILEMETTFISSNGQPIAVRGNLHPYLAGNEIVATQGFFLNVTEEKRAIEEAARLQAALLKAASEWTRTVDAAPLVIILVDLDGRVLRMNRLAMELTGRDYKDNLDRNVGELGAGEPWKTAKELVENLRKCSSGGTQRTSDEGGMRSWEVSLNLSSRSASDEMITIVARDITETVELQESLRRSELMSSLGSLVAGVAHEVRNPLFSISAVLDAFEARFKDAIDLQKYVDMLRADIGRLSVLMEDLIDYGRPPTLDLNLGTFAKVVSSAVRQTTRLAESRKLRLVQEFPEVDFKLFMDQARMTQVFTNLIENAIQHSPSGGCVTVTARELQKGNGRWVECCVEDCGPGFDASVTKKIFEPFFSRRPGGTGLGLSIVHRIVEEHGGEVVAGNRDSGGGVVTVTLPLLGGGPGERFLEE